jgi:D-serine deaminase-like pyridoxal phosphate-dependent protein
LHESAILHERLAEAKHLQKERMNNSDTDRLFHALRHAQTPALVVDENVLDRNIAAMADFARRARRSLRPHAKTHKCAAIAQKQIAAGAIGVCCATVSELRDLADASITGLLLTAPIQDPAKVEGIIAAAKIAPINIAVDHPRQLELLAASIPADVSSIGVLIDVDVGQKRTGVGSAHDSIAITRKIAADKRFRFRGLQGYAGHAQHIVNFDERSREAARVGALLGEHIAALRQAGFEVPIVSGGGTGTHDIDFAHHPFTEIQAGSYIFMDADYARIRTGPDGGLPFECSLFILTTVTSANVAGQITVDAGTKSLAVNGPPPHLILGAPRGTSFQFAGDEHAILRMPEGAEAPTLGSRILMSVTHCDPTINLFSALHVVSHNGDLKKWPIIGRN